ncbi:MAG: SpoIIE family protein phosphatase [Cytophagales bacterium]|nr:SpoIIE family protein phosphatase [Cytophagales bacterium]
MSNKLVARISFFGALLFWVLFTVFDIYFLFIEKYEMNVNLAPIVPRIFFALFIVSTFSYYRLKIIKADSVNFIDLLWKIFMTGLVTTIGALGVRFFVYAFSSTSLGQNPVMINLLYHFLVGMIIIFLISTVVVWKRLILYQKSKTLLQLWNFFEYALVFSLGFDLLGNEFKSELYVYALIFVTGFSLVLSLNLKWIAYLNFKQKLKSILFILLSGIYLYHFVSTLLAFKETGLLIFDLYDNVLVMALFIFCLLYTTISVLVTLFNLPTSSVFERKLQEAVDFQKLSQAIPQGQTEEQTYDILLESSMSAVFADAAWLEIRTKEHPDGIFYLRGIKHSQISEVKEEMELGAIKDIIRFETTKLVPSNKLTGYLKRQDLKSIMALPVMVKEKQIGSLVLLQELGDAFNRDLVDIVVTFVNQASISIENFTLLSDSLKNERYKEQLKIAQEVQNSLLPDHLAHNSSFDICAFAEAAEEVGGDYYDILELEEDKFGLIIGDVSGKGTSAAFHMAQMKGIFHSLALRDVTPAEFFKTANKALSACLEKKSFITASYFWINTKKSELEFSRAGHVPAFLYRSDSGNVESLEESGMGLGILRNLDYDKYVQSSTVPYNQGDVLLLYTDGIPEAKNNVNQQFDFDRLKESLKKHSAGTPVEIRDGIINELNEFLDGVKLDDDYTMIVVKFN